MIFEIGNLVNKSQDTKKLSEHYTPYEDHDLDKNGYSLLPNPKKTLSLEASPDTFNPFDGDKLAKFKNNVDKMLNDLYIGQYILLKYNDFTFVFAVTENNQKIIEASILGYPHFVWFMIGRHVDALQRVMNPELFDIICDLHTLCDNASFKSRKSSALLGGKPTKYIKTSNKVFIQGRNRCIYKLKNKQFVKIKDTYTALSETSAKASFRP